MTYLIVGRTGAGKDYLVSKLISKGLKAVKSYTTRPKRSETEDTHIFISKEDADAITDKVATTTINGYEYFATAEQVNEADVYVIDPNGLYELVKNMPDTTFRVVYIKADPMDRRLHAVKRADDKIREEQIFDERNESENQQFLDFENEISKINDEQTPSKLPANVTAVQEITNYYHDESIDGLAQFMICEKTIHDRMTMLVKEGAELSIFQRNENDPSKLNIIMQNLQVVPVTEEHMADTLLGDAEGMQRFIHQFIFVSDRFCERKTNNAPTE